MRNFRHSRQQVVNNIIMGIGISYLHKYGSQAVVSVCWIVFFAHCPGGDMVINYYNISVVAITSETFLTNVFTANSIFIFLFSL